MNFEKSKNNKIKAHAHWQIGLLKFHGIHYPKNLIDAEFYFNKAYQLGSKEALNGLINCAMIGCNREKNINQAKYYIKELSKTDKGRSLFYEWFFAPDKDKNLINYYKIDKLAKRSKAIDSLMQSAMLGNFQAINELGIFYAYIKNPKMQSNYLTGSAKIRNLPKKTEK